MSAAAIFYGQFAGAQTPARGFSFTQRVARALVAIGLTLVGAYPEPKARRMIGAQGVSVPGRETQS
jgi:hypothetical protein